MSETNHLSGSQPGSVLVVDDDAEVREGLCEFLAGEGYLVKSACDGAEAIDQLKRKPTDIVVLDLRMPGMDGYEFLRLRESEGFLRTIPVVVVSATPDERQVSFAGVSMLRKPVKAALLLEIIDAEIAKRFIH